MEQTIWQDSGIGMWFSKRSTWRREGKEKGDQTNERKEERKKGKRNVTEPCNMRQIIWDHKACIQQYLQRVMNTTGGIRLTQAFRISTDVRIPYSRFLVRDVRPLL